jgi:hypothetical protein
MSLLRSVGAVLLAAALIAGAAVFVDPGVASADGDRTCRGPLGGVTIHGNLTVPRWATCTLNRTTVDGNVIVRSNARVEMIRARVDGNVQGSGRLVIVRSGSVIGGDVQIDYGRRVIVTSSRVDGNIQLKGNRGLSSVLGNTVDGDVQLFSNPGGFSVWTNRIDGNLQCTGNGLPRTGDRNIVEGDREGQCRYR